MKISFLLFFLAVISPFAYAEVSSQSPEPTAVPGESPPPSAWPDPSSPFSEIFYPQEPSSPQPPLTSDSSDDGDHSMDDDYNAEIAHQFEMNPRSDLDEPGSSSGDGSTPDGSDPTTFVVLSPATPGPTTKSLMICLADDRNDLGGCDLKLDQTACETALHAPGVSLKCEWAAGKCSPISEGDCLRQPTYPNEDRTIMHVGAYLKMRRAGKLNTLWTGRRGVRLTWIGHGPEARELAELGADLVSTNPALKYGIVKSRGCKTFANRTTAEVQVQAVLNGMKQSQLDRFMNGNLELRLEGNQMHTAMGSMTLGYEKADYTQSTAYMKYRYVGPGSWDAAFVGYDPCKYNRSPVGSVKRMCYADEVGSTLESKCTPGNVINLGDPTIATDIESCQNYTSGLWPLNSSGICIMKK